VSWGERSIVAVATVRGGSARLRWPVRGARLWRSRPERPY